MNSLEKKKWNDGENSKGIVWEEKIGERKENVIVEKEKMGEEKKCGWRVKRDYQIIHGTENSEVVVP